MSLRILRPQTFTCPQVLPSKLKLNSQGKNGDLGGLPYISLMRTSSYMCNPSQVYCVCSCVGPQVYCLPSCCTIHEPIPWWGIWNHCQSQLLKLITHKCRIGEGPDSWVQGPFRDLRSVPKAGRLVGRWSEDPGTAWLLPSTAEDPACWKQVSSGR